MAMFPIIPEDIPAQTAEDIGRVPAFDSTSCRFLLQDGALVERSGRAAVRQWFDLMLRQQVDKIPIYRTEGQTKLGVDREMLGSKLPSGLITAEIERNVRETAAFCPAIRSLDSFKFTRVRRGVKVRFTVRLHTGESEEVTTYVSE